MSDKQKYIYWCDGDELPEFIPDGCMVYYVCGWKSESLHPAEWRRRVRRWPLDDNLYRAYHAMIAWPCTCPSGYDVIDFRIPLKYELVLLGDGTVELSAGLINIGMPILKKLDSEPKWVIPNDNDAKYRPDVEVRDHNGQAYRSETLIAVGGKHRLYYTRNMNNGDITAWKQCRMSIRCRCNYGA